MSIYTIERVLFDLTSNPQAPARFREDAATFLAAYPLAQDEASIIRTLDVRAMHDRGVDAMLAMRAFNAIEGRARMPEYMLRINTPAQP
jgi:hypothetical protein